MAVNYGLRSSRKKDELGFDNKYIRKILRILKAMTTDCTEQVHTMAAWRRKRTASGT